MTPADCYDFAKEGDALHQLCYSFVNEHGCSLDEVAEYLGLTTPVVLTAMDAKPITQETAERHFEIWALSQKRLTWKAVAEYRKCSPSTAQQMLSALRKKFRKLSCYQRKPRSN